MNRRQKIIVSVTGIFIVLLILVGLTYAYFLTRITGNTNSKSISVTTANLELVYSDETSDLITSTNPIVPGKFEDTKTFKVTNNGDDSNYMVMIDEVKITYASNSTITDEEGNEVLVTEGQPTTFKSNDFVYTLICKKSDNTDCNDITEQTTFPINGGMLISNDIEKDDEHTYTLKIWYLDNGEDQSKDMNKKYQARVNIAASTDGTTGVKNKYMTGITSIDNNSLAYNIINNAKINKNGTKLLSVADTPVASDIARYREEKVMNVTNWDYGTKNDLNACTGTPAISCNSEMIGKWYGNAEDCTAEGIITGCDASRKPIVAIYNNVYESSLVSEQDDYGTSYYYRGAVEDNYVNFAGMCWKIVRIAGDGSTKLILEDQYAECDDDETVDTQEIYTGDWKINSGGNYGFVKNSEKSLMNYLNPVNDADKSMVKAFYNFQTQRLNKHLNKLKSGDWCLEYKPAYLASEDLKTVTPLTDDEMISKYSTEEAMYYNAFIRLYEPMNMLNPTLKCNGTILDEFADVESVSSKAPMYVSAITADEIVYAGAKFMDSNSNFYLKPSDMFYALTPSYFDGLGDVMFVLTSLGDFAIMDANSSVYFRPLVSLAPSVVISGGEGTIGSPYVIAD